MIYKPYSIVVVPFPFTDANKTKSRPALVLSSIDHQKQTEHITLLMITSAKNNPWPNDHKISELKSTGLTAESLLRQKLFTIDIRLVKKAIGQLAEVDKLAVKKRIDKHLQY